MDLQIRDLVFGNWFLGFDDKPFQWKLEHCNLMFNDVSAAEIIKSPIPLTEEWLVKFGFGKSEEHV